MAVWWVTCHVFTGPRCYCATSQDISASCPPSVRTEHYSRTMHCWSCLEDWMLYEQPLHCWRTQSALTKCYSWLGAVSLLVAMIGSISWMIVVALINTTFLIRYKLGSVGHFWPVLKAQCRNPRGLLLVPIQQSWDEFSCKPL